MSADNIQTNLLYCGSVSVDILLFTNFLILELITYHTIIEFWGIIENRHNRFIMAGSKQIPEETVSLVALYLLQFFI